MSNLDKKRKRLVSGLDIYTAVQRGQIGHMPKKTTKAAEPIEPPNNIKDARERAELSMEQLAEMIGTTASTISKLEKSQRHVTLDWLKRIADALKVRPSSLIFDMDRSQSVPTVPVRVRGTVQAGLFQEALEWPLDDQYEVWAPVQTQYASLPLFAVKVTGPSMDLRYPESTLAICVRLIDLKDHTPESGKRYLVYRRDKMGNFECTIKELRLDGNGEAWLWPRSSHPDYQQPWKLEHLTDHLPDGDDDIVIWALVVGSYSPD